MMYMVFLFLFVCIFNIVGLLFFKFVICNGDVVLCWVIGVIKGVIFV